MNSLVKQTLFCFLFIGSASLSMASNASNSALWTECLTVASKPLTKTPIAYRLDGLNASGGGSKNLKSKTVEEIKKLSEAELKQIPGISLAQIDRERELLQEQADLIDYGPAKEGDTKKVSHGRFTKEEIDDLGNSWTKITEEAKEGLASLEKLDALRARYIEVYGRVAAFRELHPHLGLASWQTRSALIIAGALVTFFFADKYLNNSAARAYLLNAGSGLVSSAQAKVAPFASRFIGWLKSFRKPAVVEGVSDRDENPVTKITDALLTTNETAANNTVVPAIENKNGTDVLGDMLKVVSTNSTAAN